MNKKTILTILLAVLLFPLGTEAKKKAKEEAVPQLTNYPSATLDEQLFQGGDVVLKGHIAGLSGNDIPEEDLAKINGRLSVIMHDYVTNRKERSVIEFGSNGTFSLNVHVPHPMFLFIHPTSMVYACPGDTLELTIDPTKPTKEEGVTWTGTGVSGEVTRLYEKIHKAYCDIPLNYIYKKGPDSVMIWKDKQVEQLDDLVRRMNAGLPELAECSPLASDILRTHILAQHLYSICCGFEYQEEDSIPDIDSYWQRYFSFAAPREKYLLDNPLLMIAGDFFFFNRVEFSLMRPLRFSHWEGNTCQTAMNELHDKLHLSPTDFTAQVCQLRFSCYEIFNWHKNDNDKAADIMAATLPVITHPEVCRHAVRAYRDYVKKYEIKVEEQKPLTKGDSIFQRIIEPYKGNVLYVDFWEMSCGPCRAKMLSMRDEVEANKDKPVKYIYITDDTPEKCHSFLEPNNIKGEHIHVTRQEWGYLSEKFNFSGIPFIVLFDKQGKQRDDTDVEHLLNE